MAGGFSGGLQYLVAGSPLRFPKISGFSQGTSAKCPLITTRSATSTPNLTSGRTHEVTNANRVVKDAPSSVVDPNKFKYVFGEVTSGTHNTQRSLQNAAQMNRIGIHNTAEGQKYLTQHLQRVAQDRSSVARTFQKTLPDGSTITLEVRESLLSGPGGFLTLESTWEILADGTRRLSTIIPFGG